MKVCFLQASCRHDLQNHSSVVVTGAVRPQLLPILLVPTIPGTRNSILPAFPE